MNPSNWSSGQTSQPSRAITKKGPAALRLAFYQAANVARTIDPQLAAFYRKLMVERGHCHAKATARSPASWWRGRCGSRVPAVRRALRGRRHFREWRRQYPAKLAFEIRRIRGRGDLWVAENSIRYDDGPWNFTVSILEFRGEKVASESIYITQACEPPDWRAPWRATP